MKVTLYVFVLCFFISITVNAQLYAPSDPLATPETRELFYSMQRLQGAGIMFGHHDDTAYGVGWRYKSDSSDVKSVSGSYPAVYGWDFARIEHDSPKDINGIPYQLQRKLVRQVYERGGINTFCWHMDNPTNGKTAWDTTHNSVKDILPGGSAHAVYVQWLDKMARYARTLKGADGEAIPILFRPFHELTGNWFWWCRNTCTPEEFKSLWRFTIDYLRNTKKLHNMLIVYSVADFDSKEDFLLRYPGDAYVDFIGFDNYCRNDIAGYARNLDKRLTIQEQIALEHHKISCLAETGYYNLPTTDWWTKVLLPILVKHPTTSYVLLWRNDSLKQFFVPYPGQQSAEDFKQFTQSQSITMERRLAPLAVYGYPPAP